MFRPATEPWTEAELTELGPDEYDFQEFKRSAWIWDGGAIATGLQVTLSKQVSAFANGGGGRIVVGVDDVGVIDGGVPVDIKPGGTRCWLEDVIPDLVRPRLARFNVFEVAHSGEGSAIIPGSAVSGDAKTMRTFGAAHCHPVSRNSGWVNVVDGTTCWTSDFDRHLGLVTIRDVKTPTREPLVHTDMYNQS